MSARRTGLQYTSVSFLGTDYLADVTSIDVEVENTAEEGKGIADRWKYPCTVGSGVSITADILVPAESGVGLIGSAYSSNVGGAFSVVTGTATYTGSALISNLRHHGERDGLQAVNVTFQSYGTVTVA